MATLRHSTGDESTQKHKASVSIMCREHPEGHHCRMYSGQFDDAWWLADVLATMLAAHGHVASVTFWTRSGDGAWEAVSPIDAVPGDPRL